MLKGSRIAEENRLHFGGWAGLVFGGRLALGGGGFSLLENVELAGSEAGTGFDLGMGYAGVVVKYWQPLGPRVSGELGALLGAGHAEVQDRLVGTEVGSDNFFVAEPELSVFISVLKDLRLGASAGYRIVWGVEDLPRTSADDLRSITGTLSIRLGGF
jgi:hypothetical protein